jgi:phospholipid-binding lipoprotein MlaA
VSRSARVRTAVLVLAVAAAGCASAPPDDRWQAWNRPVFRFNDHVDTYFLRPIARGWTFITFEELRKSVARFYINTRFPQRFVSSLGQGKGEMALEEVGRFIVNSTIGIGGLFDPATPLGFPRGDEDIGQMFGRWGIPPGPYWVIPLLGPSDPRDAVGMVADSFLNPLTWFVPFSGSLDIVNRRAMADKEIEDAKKTSLDYYVFVRDAYVQNRKAAVEDHEEGTTPGGGPPEDLYDLPEDSNSHAPSP